MGWSDTVVKLCGRAGEHSAWISSDGFAGVLSRMRAAFAQHFRDGGKLCRSGRTHVSILGPARRGARLSVARSVSDHSRRKDWVILSEGSPAAQDLKSASMSAGFQSFPLYPLQ